MVYGLGCSVVMWDSSRAEIEPLFTTEQSGKPMYNFLMVFLKLYYKVIYALTLSVVSKVIDYVHVLS